MAGYRWWVIVLTGCGFTQSVSQGTPADGRAIDAPPATGDGSVLDAPVAIDAPAIAPFCDPTDATLVACYPFDGNLLDASGHGHDPTTISSVGFASGKVGNALVLGTTTEIDVADSSAFDVPALTIEAWVNPTLASFTGGRGGILDCEGQFGFFVQASGALTCTAGASVTTSAVIPSGTWTHVACTSDGGTAVTIYISGVLSKSVGGAAISTATTTGITLGGNNPAGGGNPLVGMLDQLRLFKAARTATQICRDAGLSNCP